MVVIFFSCSLDKEILYILKLVVSSRTTKMFLNKPNSVAASKMKMKNKEAKVAKRTKKLKKSFMNN